MPLRLPDKLPAIELLKHENIFVMDESRAHKQEIRPLKNLCAQFDAPQDYDRDRSRSSSVEYSSSVRGLFYEVEKSHAKEYSNRAHDDVLQGFSGTFQTEV